MSTALYYKRLPLKRLCNAVKKNNLWRKKHIIHNLLPSKLQATNFFYAFSPPLWNDIMSRLRWDGGTVLVTRY